LESLERREAAEEVEEILVKVLVDCSEELEKNLLENFQGKWRGTLLDIAAWLHRFTAVLDELFAEVKRKGEGRVGVGSVKGVDPAFLYFMFDYGLESSRALMRNFKDRSQIQRYTFNSWKKEKTAANKLQQNEETERNKEIKLQFGSSFPSLLKLHVIFEVRLRRFWWVRESGQLGNTNGVVPRGGYNCIQHGPFHINNVP
jgi:hypothetical protein